MPEFDANRSARLPVRPFLEADIKCVCERPMEHKSFFAADGLARHLHDHVRVHLVDFLGSRGQRL